MKVLVVAEYYPRASDPVLGIWAHRQAMAARDAGAEIRVLVLHRPVPPLAALRKRDPAAIMEPMRQPAAVELDGIPVEYVRYLSPPRPWSYGSWGSWAAPALALALRRARSRFAFELIHAHYAAPPGDAVRRASPTTPLVVSAHGGDVRSVARLRTGARAVRAAFEHARLVLANSAGTARRCTELGARRTKVVHLGADLPSQPSPDDQRTLVTVAQLIARKRHADVISALALLRSRHPSLRYVIVGDGPERERLQALAVDLGVAERVEFRGRLDHAEAVSCAQRGTVFVLPSTDEAFGVGYVEAMAAGVPAIGCAGEDGPEEIASSGGGIALVPPGDVEAIANRIDGLISDPKKLSAMGSAARRTVEAAFTWGGCGADTVAAYEQALAQR